MLLASPERLRGGPRGSQTGGWRRLPKRLGAVTVGFKCHCSWHLPPGKQWLGIGWAPWRGGGGTSLPLMHPWARNPCTGAPDLIQPEVTRKTPSPPSRDVRNGRMASGRPTHATDMQPAHPQHTLRTQSRPLLSDPGGGLSWAPARAQPPTHPPTHPPPPSGGGLCPAPTVT